MPDLLLELFSEEIPARLQAKAAGNLRKLVTDAVVDAGLTYEGAKEYWTPRRLVLDIRGLTARSADIREEKKGPRKDAPQKAIEGFLRGAGLQSIDQAEIRSDPKKGEFYVAVIEKPGRDAADIVAEIMPGIIANFSWPKSMRWGSASVKPGSLTWVRPLQSILCMFGPETEEPEIVEFEIGGIKSSNKTYGHRFIAPGEITVKRFDDYAANLRNAHVIIDAEQRKQMILTDASNLAFAQGLELVEDAKLLDGVSGLVEWPTVLMGEFDQAFLDIPPEVIQLTIRENQKCFVLKSQKTGKLVNRFLLVSNIIPSDNGIEVARGNGKVVNARLADAKFFWESDLAQVASEEGFGPWIEKLDTVTFHAKLGTQGERVQRIIEIASELAVPIASSLGVSENQLAEQATRAALLCKADLNAAMVIEFPELQGFIGKTYALRAEEDPSVAAAIEDHYKPLGPTDDVPSDPVSVAVALADKLDVLVGFWAIDEKPTGSKDPFALRRASRGVIRSVLENGVQLNIRKIILTILAKFTVASEFSDIDDAIGAAKRTDALQLTEGLAEQTLDHRTSKNSIKTLIDQTSPIAINQTLDLLSFFHDRLKVYLRDKGIRHDLIDAVITPESDDLLTITRRAEALQELIASEDGANLLAGYKRAANILAAEEKKGADTTQDVDTELLQADEEIALNAKMDEVEALAADALEQEDYASAMTTMAMMRPSIDAFFDNVMVNDDNKKIRTNRLALLNRIRNVTGKVADFSKISG